MVCYCLSHASFDHGLSIFLDIYTHCARYQCECTVSVISVMRASYRKHICVYKLSSYIMQYYYSDMGMKQILHSTQQKNCGSDYIDDQLQCSVNVTSLITGISPVSSRDSFWTICCKRAFWYTYASSPNEFWWGCRFADGVSVVGCSSVVCVRN